jgi:aminoglycoside phosphotransferase family enzyme
MHSTTQTVDLAEKVAFLQRPDSYPESPKAVEAVETHLAWVFLTDRHAYKLKKPVRYPFLDFTTLEARHADAREEVRLNHRLAPGVYLGVVPLALGSDGRLRIDRSGTPVDWLVKMRRLPRTGMLDYAIAAGTVQPPALRALSDLILAFYRSAATVPIDCRAYQARFRKEVDENAQALREPRYGLSPTLVATITTAQHGFLDRGRKLLEARASAGRIVEGHGDLRPEHVCLGPPPVIIDCVEFNREFRILDPVDELGYLAMECERLGAPWAGRVLLTHYTTFSGDRPPERLVHFYQSVRATLRAKLAAWHLDDVAVRYPSQWFNRAEAYLALAERHAREA